MVVEIIVTVNGVGYKGVFGDTMTQKEIMDQIRFAFKQLKLFPKENANLKVEMVKPAATNLQTLEQVKVS